uniref:Uncharacterized protein n=1 Tax=Manihot esculenta TaxID=3983 RepID=A0A199UBR0_MANES
MKWWDIDQTQMAGYGMANIWHAHSKPGVESRGSG